MSVAALVLPGKRQRGAFAGHDPQVPSIDLVGLQYQAQAGAERIVADRAAKRARHAQAPQRDRDIGRRAARPGHEFGGILERRRTVRHDHVDQHFAQAEN